MGADNHAEVDAFTIIRGLPVGALERKVGQGLGQSLRWVPTAEGTTMSWGGGEAETSVGGSPGAPSSVEYALSRTETDHSSRTHRIDSRRGRLLRSFLDRQVRFQGKSSGCVAIVARGGRREVDCQSHLR